MDHPDTDPLPIRCHHNGQPIPDLSQIPRERWLEVLVPLTPRAREMAIDLASTRVDDLAALGELKVDAWMLPKPKRPSLQVGAPLPAGTLAGAADGRRDRRQVSFRLSDAHYAELVAAGETVGLRAASLARVLVQNGVRRMLFEARSRGEV